MLTIVLADDHYIMRQGLRLLLEEQPDFSIVGEANSGEEALQLVKSLRPDILVADMVMAGVNGVKLTEQTIHYSPNTAVIILSMYGIEGYVHKAMRAGAKAYVLKEST